MKKINFITDLPNLDKESELNSAPNLKELIKKAKRNVSSNQIDMEILQKNLASTYDNFITVIKNSVLNNDIKPKEIKFSIGIESDGSIGVLSMVNASQKSISTIEFTIVI